MLTKEESRKVFYDAYKNLPFSELKSLAEMAYIDVEDNESDEYREGLITTLVEISMKHFIKE